MARWAKFEENALWHAKVAQILGEHGHTDEASKELQASIAIDDQLWLSWGGLAKCYAEKHEIDRAIETMKKARTVLEATPELPQRTWCLHHVANKTGEWCLSSGKTDAAIENFKEAFRLCQDYGPAIKTLGILHGQKRYQEIMGFLEEVQAETMPNTGLSKLTVCLQDLISSFGDPEYGDLMDVLEDAARATNRMDYLMDVIQVSVNDARKSAKMGIAGLLQNQLGSLIQRYVRDEAKAIRLWEQIMETSSASKLISHLGRARTNASINLAMRYYDKALAAGKGTPDCEAYIKKLENLSRYKVSPRDDAELQYFRTTRETTLVLGRLYMLIGNEDEARECFRILVKLGIDFLTDDDPDNDWYGHHKLAHVSLHANDDLNAAAAYSLLGPKERDASGDGAVEAQKSESNNEKSTSSEKGSSLQAIEKQVDVPNEKSATVGEDEEQPEIDLEGEGSWVCNGPCTTQRSKPDGLHACRACLDLDFCDECVELVKNDKLPFMLCNPEHEFFLVPTATKRLPKGMVLYDGQEIEIGKWLKALMQRWDLSIVKE